MKKISLLLLAGCVFALTGDELASQMDSRKTPTDSKVDLLMTLINKKGKNRKLVDFQVKFHLTLKQVNKNFKY